MWTRSISGQHRETTCDVCVEAPDNQVGQVDPGSQAASPQCLFSNVGKMDVKEGPRTQPMGQMP